MTKGSLDKVVSHFRKYDPIVYKQLIKMNIATIRKPKSSPQHYFFKLCVDIISQQLSIKAADAVVGRFCLLFPRRIPKTKLLINIEDEKLRGVGMSWQKAKYIKDLAVKIETKELNLKNIHTLKNEEVIDELIKVKGIGRWTAEMFLIFTLGRENVYSHGDLGLKRAMQNLYKLKERPTEDQAEKIVKKWHPFKSYGALALWDSLDNT